MAESIVTAGSRNVEGHEERRKDQDCEQEIGCRSSKNDQEALPHGPQLECLVAQMLRDAVELGRVARRGHVADELHIAAKRQPGDLPASPLTVGTAKDFVPEADRKCLGRDLEETRDEIVTELVREHLKLTPRGIMEELDLRRPIYKKTAAFGHFGRTDIDLPWERRRAKEPR